VTDGGRAIPPAAPAGSDARGDESRVDAAPPALAALWATTLQAVANHVAHDFRNALNGVAVNLEVVRGRSARGAEASTIAPFAATAAAQFETASAAAEAMLAFARAEPGDADVSAIAVRLSRLVALRGASMLTVTDGASGRARTSVPGEIVRTVVARSVLSALGTGDSVACEITVGDDIFLHVTGASHVPPPPDSELLAVASDYGVRFASRGHTLEVRFPAAHARVTPHDSA